MARFVVGGGLKLCGFLVLLVVVLGKDPVSASRAPNGNVDTNRAPKRQPIALSPPRRHHVKIAPKESDAIALQILSTLRGGGDNSEFVGQAYDWATNLGAPAALVAGAVIATLYEDMSSGALDVEQADKAWVKIAKKATRLLLVSAFIQEVVCIFCTTILGTHLLSSPAIGGSHTRTALEYLRENYEFEYLTSRISFIQGLVTWLGGIALEHAIPQGGEETQARRRMDILIASSLSTLIIAMLSFYNGHMNFYKNYFDMLCRYAQVIWLRYVWMWPPRILTVLAIPPFVTSVVYFFIVFLDFEIPLPQQKKKTK